MTTDNTTESPTVCDFRPFPGNGAYGHWTCQRRHGHMGRHRFGNYTIARMPHVWRLRGLWRSHLADRRMRHRGKSGLGYRHVLFPTRYEPVQ